MTTFFVNQFRIPGPTQRDSDFVKKTTENFAGCGTPLVVICCIVAFGIVSLAVLFGILFKNYSETNKSAKHIVYKAMTVPSASDAIEFYEVFAGPSLKKQVSVEDYWRRIESIEKSHGKLKTLELLWSTHALHSGRFSGEFEYLGTYERGSCSIRVRLRSVYKTWLVEKLQITAL